jgi:hypothetical protein
MREIPEIGHEAQTLIAVGVGAVLATIGGFLASLLEARVHRRHREQTAAITFGEIVASLNLLIRAIQDAHGVGEPFGQLTMRLIRAARREVDAYERNRAALADLRDTDLRLSMHALMMRMALALDGILEVPTEDLRASSYEYLLEITPGLEALVLRLVPVAGQPITPYAALSHHPTDPRQRAA